MDIPWVLLICCLVFFLPYCSLPAYIKDAIYYMCRDNSKSYVWFVINVRIWFTLLIMTNNLLFVYRMIIITWLLNYEDKYCFFYTHPCICSRILEKVCILYYIVYAYMTSWIKVKSLWSCSWHMGSYHGRLIYLHFRNISTLFFMGLHCFHGS